MINECKMKKPHFVRKFVRHVPDIVDVLTGDETIGEFIAETAEGVLNDAAKSKEATKKRRCYSMHNLIKLEKKIREKETLIAEKPQMQIIGALYFDVVLGSYRLKASYPGHWSGDHNILLSRVIEIQPVRSNTIHMITFDDLDDRHCQIIVDLDEGTILDYFEDIGDSNDPFARTEPER